MYVHIYTLLLRAPHLELFLDAAVVLLVSIKALLRLY